MTRRTSLNFVFCEVMLIVYLNIPTNRTGDSISYIKTVNIGLAGEERRIFSIISNLAMSNWMDHEHVMPPK